MVAAAVKVVAGWVVVVMAAVDLAAVEKVEVVTAAEDLVAVVKVAVVVAVMVVAAKAQRRCRRSRQSTLNSANKTAVCKKMMC